MTAQVLAPSTEKRVTRGRWDLGRPAFEPCARAACSRTEPGHSCIRCPGGRARRAPPRRRSRPHCNTEESAPMLGSGTTTTTRVPLPAPFPREARVCGFDAGRHSSSAAVFISARGVQMAATGIRAPACPLSLLCPYSRQGSRRLTTHEMTGPVTWFSIWAA